MPDITKIVITGGPCAGKTTLMARAIQELSERGIRVLVVPEAATTLIAGMNIVPGKSIDLEAFRKYVIDIQFANEKLVELAAYKYAGTQRVVILCDRGKLDGLAYVSRDIIDAFLGMHLQTLIAARDEYDAVIHLVTAADGAPEAYTTANNSARTETPEEAIEKDRRTIAAWNGHPHLSIIDNSTGFEQKVQRAVAAIYDVLGLPVPVERERKFLINKPDMSNLLKYDPVRSEILQTYLPNDGDTERRVRQRGDGKNFTFFYTEKTPVPGSMTDRVEKEKRISNRDYVAYLATADYTAMTPVKKTRYCFPYGNLYIELDIYPDSEYAIVEVEQVATGDALAFPPEINIVCEVTGDKRFSNYEISRNGAKLPG